MEKPKVIILRGCSGSGKSTYIKTHLPLSRVCSADHFFMEDNKYVFVPEKLNLAHATCINKFLELLDAFVEVGTDLAFFVIDNTNISVADIAPYVALASAYGLEHEIVTLDCPPELATNVHGVPPAKVRAQYKYMKMQEKQFPRYWNHTILKYEDYRK